MRGLGDEPPSEFGVGELMQVVPRFKNTHQNSPKHAISGEKFIFFWGGAATPHTHRRKLRGVSSGGSCPQ